jgi:hypothetical protein
MTMFTDIENVVKQHINKEKLHFNKQELLVYFSIKNTGFNNIMSDLLKFDWLKYKRIQPIINIIKHYIVLYLSK